MNITFKKKNSIYGKECQICDAITYLPQQCERCKKRACSKPDCVSAIDAEYCAVTGKTDLWDKIK